MERGDRRLTGLPAQVLSERKFVGVVLQGEAKLKTPVRTEPHPTKPSHPTSASLTLPGLALGKSIGARSIQELHLGLAFHSPDLTERPPSTDHFNPALQFNIIA